MEKECKIGVLLVDDHTLFREGIRSILEGTDDIEVVGSVPSGEDAINQVRIKKPHVILMDILMRGMTGLEATRWIKENNPHLKIIIVTMDIGRESVSAGIKLGVDGFLNKDVDEETLLESIRSVYKGGRFFNDAIVKLVFDDFYAQEKFKPSKKNPNELTNRESEILGLAVSGKTNRELAKTLVISIKTVEAHKSNILEKLGLRNTADLVKYAIKNKLVSIESL